VSQKLRRLRCRGGVEWKSAALREKWRLLLVEALKMALLIFSAIRVLRFDPPRSIDGTCLSGNENWNHPKLDLARIRAVIKDHKLFKMVVYSLSKTFEQSITLFS